MVIESQTEGSSGEAIIHSGLMKQATQLTEQICDRFSGWKHDVQKCAPRWHMECVLRTNRTDHRNPLAEVGEVVLVFRKLLKHLVPGSF
jgi:hypothetical protein